MPRLSIVIPCLGGAADFDGTLVSVLQHRPDDCEVIVVHAQPYGDPYRLAGEVAFVHEESSDLVHLLNKGIEQAAGEIVHTLATGIEATDGWTEAACQQFSDPDVLSVAPVVLAEDGQSVAAAGVQWSLGGARKIAKDRRLLSPGAGRLRARILGPTLSAGFYRREALVAVGGFDARLGEALADVDMALALRSLGGLNVCEPASRLLQSSAPPPLQNGFSAGRRAERLFWRYVSQRGMALALVAHPWTIGLETARLLPKAAALSALIGRSVALLELGAGRRQVQRLETAGQHLAEAAKRRAEATKPPATIRMPARDEAPSTGEAKPRRSRRAA